MHVTSATSTRAFAFDALGYLFLLKPSLHLVPGRLALLLFLRLIGCSFPGFSLLAPSLVSVRLQSHAPDALVSSASGDQAQAQVKVPG